MALWGISTTTETADNNFALPKNFKDTDRNYTSHNVFADVRGWVYRHYGTTDQSGLSTSFYDEVLVPVIGLNTTGIGSHTTGLGDATPVAIFFEDPNLASPISIGAGGTAGIKTGTTGYVHLVFNENVFVSAGATVAIGQANTTGAGVATIVAYAASMPVDSPVYNYLNSLGFTTFTNYNGQVTNRVAFAFTAPATGVGSVLRIDTTAAFTGIVTDFYDGVGVTSAIVGDIIRNVGGAGNTADVGIGTTTLTIVA